MHLTLIVPELIWPEPDDVATFAALDCPALATLLTRSRRVRRPPQSLEATLSDAFGLPDGAPYAALRLLGENAAPNPGPSTWLCGDPVHLRFHQQRLIVADSGSFAITLDEARALVDALNAQLSAAGRFHLATADRWYLELAANIALERFDVAPLSAVAGRGVERLLPEGSETQALRSLLNEAQMLLHAHPVNVQRENTGQLPINSLWLWGAGKLPQRRESDFDGVWSANPLARGLAKSSGVASHPLPDDAATLLAHAAADTRHLVVLEDLLPAVQYENGKSYGEAMRWLETRWFAPLRQALIRGTLARLSLEAPTAYAALTWHSGRSAQWKFWQRAQPLAELAQALATA